LKPLLLLLLLPCYCTTTGPPSPPPYLQGHPHQGSTAQEPWLESHTRGLCCQGPGAVWQLLGELPSHYTHSHLGLSSTTPQPKPHLHP